MGRTVRWAATLLSALTGLIVLTAPAHADYRDDYINQAAPMAQRMRDTYDIPASVALGSAILESSWGRSGLTTRFNNHHGLKCATATSPGPIAVDCKQMETTECPSGCGPASAYFRVFRTMEDSFRDYGRLLSSSLYSAGHPYRHDPDAFIRAIGQKYATDPSYANKVIANMQNFNLYRFDSGSATPVLGDEGLPAAPGFRYDREQHYFGRGPDGSLRHWWWNGSAGLGQQNWGGALAGEPAGFVYRNEQHVFGRSPQNRLTHWYWRPDMSASATQDWGGSIAGTPTGFVWGDEQHVFARGADGSLQHWFWRPSMSAPATQNWGGQITGDPVSFVYGDEQHVFARSTSGRLTHWFWRPSMASPESQDWGGELAGSPTGFVWGDQQHVFARSSQGTLAHWWWSPAEGLRFADWGGQIQGDPVGYVQAGEQHVFARSTSNRLTHWYWNGALGVQDWGGEITSDPTGFAWYDQQHVFGKATNGSLTHWYWRPDMNASDNETWGGQLG